MSLNRFIYKRSKSIPLSSEPLPPRQKDDRGYGLARYGADSSASMTI